MSTAQGVEKATNALLLIDSLMAQLFRAFPHSRKELNIVYKSTCVVAGGWTFKVQLSDEKFNHKN